MQPIATLVAPSAVTSMDVFADPKGPLLVACGTNTGQALIYDLENTWDSYYKKIGAFNGQYNAKNPVKFSACIKKG